MSAEPRVRDAVHAIRARTALVPRVALTLGSGLGDAADAIDAEAVFPAVLLPHWPPSTVPGHAGRLVLGRWRGVPVVALSGRSHVYEGYPLERVTFGIRVARSLGAGTMVFTNAVGALHTQLAPGDLVLASDHVNFIGTRGLLTAPELAARGPRERAIGTHHSPRLGAALRAAALAAGVMLRSGVLMGWKGPSYETAAEVRMAAALGADVVCMSTVHEVTLAAELGAEAASISCVTNLATGLSDRPLAHEEVACVARGAADRLRALLDAFFETASGHD